MKEQQLAKKKEALEKVSEICNKIGHFIILLLLVPIIGLLISGKPVFTLPKPDAPIFVFYILPCAVIGILVAVVGFICIFLYSRIMKKLQLQRKCEPR